MHTTVSSSHDDNFDDNDDNNDNEDDDDDQVEPNLSSQLSTFVLYGLMLCKLWGSVLGPGG